MRLSFLLRDKRQRLSHTYVDSRCWGPLQSELRRINQRHFAQSKKKYSNAFIDVFEAFETYFCSSVAKTTLYLAIKRS
jgi:hypothetical protein